MNIRIITLYGNVNFGNKLQNYALQEYIKKLDNRITIKTIVPKYDKFLVNFKNIIKRIIKDKRTTNFYKFNRYINYDNKKININTPKIQKNVDYLIFGSDQVWNTSFEGKNNLFNGNFNSNAKKISYAASFGTDCIEKQFNEIYINSLNNFNFISVREEQGKRIISTLLPLKKVEVSIDPTMLLTDCEWDKISKKPKMLKSNKFILNYFLGELCEDRKNEIYRVAKENGCEVINILDKTSPFYECGPSEFLWLEKNAFLICTDSFHSSVFAILFNRPFIIFEREDNNLKMNSRLKTLLDKFNLKNRKFEGIISDENLNHDYSEAYVILEEERKKSKEFLEKSLNIKN